MTNIIRTAIVALTLVGAASAASAEPLINNNGSQNWNTDARGFFDQLQRNGN